MLMDQVWDLAVCHGKSINCVGDIMKVTSTMPAMLYIPSPLKNNFNVSQRAHGSTLQMHVLHHVSKPLIYPQFVCHAGKYCGCYMCRDRNRRDRGHNPIRNIKLIISAVKKLLLFFNVSENHNKCLPELCGDVTVFLKLRQCLEM